ncbi:MAG: signal peptidase II [Clostridiales bacterium]|nr:signal peptidase II [Clostridiales bacterium]
MSENSTNISVSDFRYKQTRITSIFMFVLLLVVGDQISKRSIVSNMQLNEKKEIISGFFSFHYVRNTGSAFSFLADKSWGIYVLSGVSLIFGIILMTVMVFAILKEHNKIALCLGLISAGAIGNLCDRFMLHYVIDFLRFDFGSYTFPIFNFADCFAVIGTFLLILNILFDSKEFDSFWNDLFKRKAKETK